MKGRFYPCKHQARDVEPNRGPSMPTLPSGLHLGISRQALFDHGGNWFSCPDGSFWYWVPDPEMGPGPFPEGTEIIQVAQHAPVPISREEAKKFIQVLEFIDDTNYVWRGEWLDTFSKFQSLSDEDMIAWQAWIESENTKGFLDATIAECMRLAEVSRNVTGHAILSSSGERSDTGEIKASLNTKPKATYDIEMHEASEAFRACWQSAGGHLNSCGQGKVVWLRAHLNPPFLEHISFRLGNQLYFVRIEDIDGEVRVPGSRDGLLAVSDGCQGHPCILPMRRAGSAWAVAYSDWGLLDARTGHAIDPFKLADDRPIEMTDWELHDFAVEVVKGQIEKDRKELMSWQSDSRISPSIWFVGDNGPEWVVVRATRYPNLEAEMPSDWDSIAERCSRKGKIGHFASVSVAKSPDDDGIDPGPLLRGGPMIVKFEGLRKIS